MPLGFKQHSSNEKFKVHCLQKTLYMVCAKALVPFGNISLKIFESVAYLKRCSCCYDLP